MSIKVILVEDDPDQAQTLLDYLATHQYNGVAAGSLREAMSLIRTGQHDICLLDLGLPDGEGIDLLREIRTISDMPVMVLSGRNTELDRVLALELGADDYMSKPLKYRELVARIRSILRRAEQPATLPVSENANDNQKVPASNHYALQITERQLVGPDGTVLKLSPVEAETLMTLIKASGRTVSRDHIIGQRAAGSDTVFDRSVDITVARLRKKLSGLDGTISIQTTRGIGYRLSGKNDIILN